MNLETHKYIKYKSKYLKIIKGGGCDIIRFE